MGRSVGSACIMHPAVKVLTIMACSIKTDFTGKFKARMHEIQKLVEYRVSAGIVRQREHAQVITYMSKNLIMLVLCLFIL